MAEEEKPYWQIGGGPWNERIIRWVRRRWAEGGWTARELADKVGIEKHTIDHIVSRKNWKNVE